MCDCYAHKCECCEELIPMHISGWRYPRNAFRVYCYKHLKAAPKGAVIFEIVELRFVELMEGFFEKWKCAIIGPGVEIGGFNSPNLAYLMRETYVE